MLFSYDISMDGIIFFIQLSGKFFAYIQKGLPFEFWADLISFG